MYYYLSFLRPPPRTSPTTSVITITPQIANDLRTEILENTPIPLLYQWILLPSSSTSTSTSPPSSSSQPTFHQPQRPLPLTTFLAPASSYKPISIPPPTNIQPNQVYALAVWAKPSSPRPTNTTEGWEVELSDLTAGGRSSCLSVLSEGVVFKAPVGTPGGGVKREKEKGGKSGGRGGGGSKGGKGGSGGGGGGGGGKGEEKQDRIRRVFVLPTQMGAAGGEGGKRRVELVEQTSFDLDKKIWDSGLALSSHLAQHLCPSSSSSSSSSLVEDASRFPAGQESLGRVLELLRSAGQKELRVLELGTGIGLVSLMLASILPSLASSTPSEPELELPISPSKSKHTFYATDLPSALPLITQNLISNASLFSSQATIYARELDWDATSLPDWVFGGEESGKKELDLIIMADVTYNSSIFPSLVRTLLALLQPQPSSSSSETTTSPLVLLSFKERDPTGAERGLWTLAEEAGIWLERVGGVKGHGATKEEGEVEVWVGGLLEVEKGV